MTLKSKSVAVLLLLCIACSNVKETPKGFQYKVIKKGDGVVGKPGDFLIASIMFKDSKDSTWYDSYKQDFQSPIPIQDTMMIKKEEGVEEVFRTLSKGDSVTFEIPAGTLFEKTFHQPLPPKLEAKSKFFFALAVHKILNQQEVTKYNQEMAAKQAEKLKKTSIIQIGKDTVAIDSFLRVKKIEALKTKTGVRYVIHDKGTGPDIKAGQQIKMFYAGYLLNGKCFDTNIKAVAIEKHINRQVFTPMALPAGEGRVVPGLDQVLLLGKKGAKMTVYIPSTLAFGPRRVSADILPNSIMIFDIEIAEVK